MRYILKAMEWVNMLSLLFYIPFLIFGKDFFILAVEHTSDSVSILCVNQAVIAVFTTFFTLIYARAARIYKTRYVVNIFKNSELHILVITAIIYISCVAVGIICFKSSLREYLTVCSLQALFVIVCSNVNKKAKSKNK